MRSPRATASPSETSWHPSRGKPIHGVCNSNAFKSGALAIANKVRLLHHGLHDVLPLLVVVLAGLVDQYEIDAAQSRRLVPLELLVRARE